MIPRKVKHWLSGAFMIFLAVLCLFQVGKAQSHRHGATHTVIIKRMQFNPPHLNVAVGDTVEWKNEDIYSHSATANDGSFDSGLIDPGKAWSTTITTAGNVGYHCRPHPNMVATIAVSDGTGSSAGEQHSQSLRFEPPRKPYEIHPILVNFTAALLPLALLSDLLGRVLRQRTLQSAGLWLVLYEAAISPLTVAAGWWWKSTAGGSLPARLITVHQWLGTAAAVLFVVLAVWRWSLHKRGVSATFAYLLAVFIAVLALAYQGSIGGAMAFGR